MAEFLNPQKILNQLKLKEDMIAADFGSGSGGWVIPLAKILKEGKVYAIDVQEEMLSALRSKAEIEHLFNIELLRQDLEKEVRLPENTLDLILMTNLLFQIEKREEIISEAKRILKNEGQLLIIDWQEIAALGPKENRVSEKEIKEIAKKLGFNLEKTLNVSPYHWGLVLRKP